MLSQPVRLSWLSKLRRPFSASVSNGKTRQDLDRVTNRFFLSRVQLAWANHPSHRHKSRAKRTVHTLCGHFPPLTCEPAQFSTARACALALFPSLDRQRAPYRGGPPAPGALLGRHAKPLRVDRQKRLAGRALDVAVGRVLAPSRACVARRIELHQPADHPVARPPPPPLVGCSRPPGPCAWHSIPAGPDRGEGARVVSSHFLFFFVSCPPRLRRHVISFCVGAPARHCRQRAERGGWRALAGAAASTPPPGSFWVGGGGVATAPDFGGPGWRRLRATWRRVGQQRAAKVRARAFGARPNDGEEPPQLPTQRTPPHAPTSPDECRPRAHQLRPFFVWPNPPPTPLN